jgi:tRNA(Arg) A34 adenosine deaminase TadA
MNDSQWNESLMMRALTLARQARRSGEPPFAALVVDPEGRVVSEATDEVERGGDFTLHAEIGAVRRACRARGRDLTGHSLYTTVEPCPMCFTAAWLARIGRIVFGCSMAAVSTATRGAQRELLFEAERLNALSGGSVVLETGVLGALCLALFQEGDDGG